MPMAYGYKLSLSYDIQRTPCPVVVIHGPKARLLRPEAPFFGFRVYRM